MLKKLGTIACILSLVSTGIIGCSQSNPSVPIKPVSEDISWAIGETTVTATITRPDTAGVHPAIVFVAGSGPTDKDWNSTLLPGTNGSARLLAYEFAKNGFITLRYDKRVTGPNAQQNLPLLIGKLSMESHVEELASAVNQLLSRSDVNPQKIFVVANSEGTIHAMNYQLEKEPKFVGLVLLAPPGRTTTDLIRSQLEAQVASLPNSKEIMAGYEKLMSDFLADKTFTADPSLPEGINKLVQSFSVPANLPFARELFKVDPASLLSQITSPILVVIGKKDIQVDWQLDGSLLEAAAGNHKNVSFNYPENANHVLKNEPRPRNALTGADALTYNSSGRVLDADALKVLSGWLTEHAGNTK
jgi:pimeloyl-ACP methyl ester carboxylesterase